MTETEFLAYWELLCEHRRIAPSAPLIRMYALTLRGEGITAQEWGTAIAASLRFDDFLPGIQKLMDYARPSFKAQALAEWDACLERVKAGQAATEPGTVRSLMNRVTNGVPLGQVDNERLPFLKGEFLERYAELLREQAQGRTPALAAPSQGVSSVLR